MKPRIAIIGAGFSGTMVAIHLIRNASRSLEIIIADEQHRFQSGIAYSPYSNNFILNVPAVKMSAFPDDPSHFLNWLISQGKYEAIEPGKLAASFVPRAVYAEYLADCWKEALTLAEQRHIQVHIYNQKVKSLFCLQDNIKIVLNDDSCLKADYVVMATGNHLPGNPPISNQEFYHSFRYFKNPWSKDAVSGVNSHLPVLIMGNGLTMAETVIGLREEGFDGEIYSVSPNGFNMLPHRQEEFNLLDVDQELKRIHSLYDVLRLFNRHAKLLRKEGRSIEPLVTTLRPHIQRLWQGFTQYEKRVFVSRLRHAWGVARHRIAPELHEQLQLLRQQKKLHVFAGKILNLMEGKDEVEAVFFEKKLRQLITTKVSRVINCTGPETNLMKLDTHFLKQCLLDGIISQDELLLGIRADIESFEVISASGKNDSRLFTLGSNLKGELWETTAVNEIRIQAFKLAGILLNRI